jgi:hypothetical protein
MQLNGVQRRSRNSPATCALDVASFHFHSVARDGIEARIGGYSFEQGHRTHRLLTHEEMSAHVEANDQL